MAAADYNPSRRALLGAAVAIPLVPDSLASSFWRMPESISSAETERRLIPDQVRGDDNWLEALAAFEAAEAVVREIEAATAGYSLDEEEELLPAHDAACDAMEAALGRILLAPVPHLAALAVKLELFFEHELEPHSASEDCLGAIRGDVRRLAGPSTGSG
jgi:hypothetical protein